MDKKAIHKVIRNILANQIGFLFSVIVTFFLSPFVVHRLGATWYGIWVLIVSVTGNYGLLAFGIQSATTRYIAFAAARRDTEKMNGYFNTAFSFLLLSAALAVLIGGIVAFFIPRICILPAGMVHAARISCLLVSMSAAATFAFAVFESSLVAHQHFHITSAIGICGTLLRAGMTVWLLLHGYGIVSLAALTAGLTFLTGAMKSVAAFKLFRWLRISFRSARRDYLKELMSYSYKSFTVGIAVALVYQCDLLIVGMHFPPAEITVYSLAGMLIIYILDFIRAIAFTFGPFATELYAKNQIAEMHNFFFRGSFLLYSLGGLIVSGLIVFGKEFFTLWMGPQYAYSAVILGVLAIPQFFTTGARVGSSLLVGMAKIGPMAIAALCEGISNLVLSLILVRHFGLLGVAIGTLVPGLVNNLWLPWYVSRVFKIKPISFYLRSMLPGLAVGAAGFIAGYFVRAIFSRILWSAFIIQISLVIICCLMFSFFIFSRQNGVSPLKVFLPGVEREAE